MQERRHDDRRMSCQDMRDEIARIERRQAERRAEKEAAAPDYGFSQETRDGFTITTEHEGSDGEVTGYTVAVDSEAASAATGEDIGSMISLPTLAEARAFIDDVNPDPEDAAEQERDEAAGGTLASLAAWMDAQADEVSALDVESADALVEVRSTLRECARQVRRVAAIEQTPPHISNEGICPHCGTSLVGKTVCWQSADFGDGTLEHTSDDRPDALYYSGDADGDYTEVVEYYCSECNGAILLPIDCEEVWS